MNKFFAVVLISLMLPINVNAEVVVDETYKNDPYVISLVKEINRLQKKLDKLEKSEKKDDEKKEQKSSKKNIFSLKSQASGLVDRDSWVTIATFVVDAKKHDLDPNTFNVEFSLSPYTPELEVKRSCSGGDVIKAGVTATCQIKVKSFGTTGKFEYTVKNPQISTVDGNKKRDKLIIVGALDVR